MSTEISFADRAAQIADAVQYCQPIVGEPGRCFVPSRSAQTPWLVDVDSYEGTGQCGCPDFTMRHEPYLNGSKSHEGYNPARRCLHIWIAVEFLHLQAARQRNGQQSQSDGEAF